MHKISSESIEDVEDQEQRAKKDRQCHGAMTGPPELVNASCNQSCCLSNVGQVVRFHGSHRSFLVCFFPGHNHIPTSDRSVQQCVSSVCIARS